MQATLVAFLVTDIDWANNLQIICYPQIRAGRIFLKNLEVSVIYPEIVLAIPKTFRFYLFQQAGIRFYIIQSD